MTARVTVVGSLNMDLIVRAPRIPRPGETIIGRGFHVAPGGKGANQAVAAARLGAQVSLVGRVGQDSFAADLLANLKAAGVNHTYVSQDAETATGVALIEVDDAGQNSIVVAAGANMRLGPAEIEAARGVITGADILLLQLESPLETVSQAAQLAQAHHVPVILNPAPAQPLPEELLKAVTILAPNESETAILAGLPTGSLAEIKAAAAKLRGFGVETVILTLGERGALLAGADGSRHFPAFRVTPVDTTAAGDAFVGALAVALAEGRPLPEAIRWANAAGALATTRLGAQPSLPSRQAVEELAASAR